MINHQMTHKKHHPDGGDEFECPVCGRRFILYIETGDRVPLTEGNPNVTHSGTVGGISMDATIEQVERLEPFAAWMDENKQLWEGE